MVDLFKKEIIWTMFLPFYTWQQSDESPSNVCLDAKDIYYVPPFFIFFFFSFFTLDQDQDQVGLEEPGPNLRIYNARAKNLIKVVHVTP